MTNILKIAECSIIGLHAALLLAKGSGKPVTTEAAAKKLGVSASHLSKVFQRLGKVGIVRAVRGPKGGYILNRPLAEIRLRDILEAVEGPILLRSCLMDSPNCGSDGCMLGGLLESISAQVLKSFERRLSDICAN
jgi:Rrf2 family protein